MYNHYLSEWNETFETTGEGLSYTLCSESLTKLKKREETLWLQEVDSIALQSYLRFIAEGFDRFFKKQNNHTHFKRRIPYSPI